MASPGSLGFQELASAPPAPPVGYCIIYAKTDNVLYLKDSSGTEIPLGTASGITSLVGDVTGVGPGATTTTVAYVAGKTAAEVATSVNLTQAATSSNTPSTIVFRDSSGNFAAGTITANLTGIASGNVAKTGDTMTGPLVISNNSAAALAVDGDVLIVDGANNRIGINKLNPTQALDVVGNGLLSGTITASNLSGTNTGDVTVTDSSDIDLTLTGQNVTADLTVTGVTATTYGSPSEVSQIVVDNKGRITSANNQTIDITASQVSDFVTEVETIVDSIIINPATTAAPIQINADGNNDLGTANTLSKSDHKHDILVGTPVQIGTSNFAGASSALARADHVHSHGNQTSGTLHAAATTSVNGFMSSTDKTKLDAATNLNTASTLVLRDSSGDFSAGTITANLTGIASGNVAKTGDTMTGSLNINDNSTTALVVDTDVLVVDASNNRIGVNKASPTQALDVVGNGTFTGTLTASNLSGTNTGDQTITLTGDVTGSGTGSFATTIANQAVTNAKLVNVSTATIKGRVTAGSGSPEDLTGTQATSLLDTFTSSLKGLVPASGGGTTNFLRADGTWTAPSVGTVTSVALTAPSTFSVSGSPVTTSGTLALSYVNQNANTVFAGPTSGAAATPSYRALVPEDLPSYLNINTQTSSYQLVLTDAGKIVELNSASAITVTIPDNATVAFPVGTQVTVVQLGAGQLTVVAGGSTVIRSPSTLILAEQYATASLYKRATDEWVLMGYLQP